MIERHGGLTKAKNVGVDPCINPVFVRIEMINEAVAA
jgi:hypothetical protein